ncbi:MAG: glycosyltransferase family 4 protein [Verrucomicrobiota bacterium]
MKIIFITPGTGDFYCGVCLRDHALVKALRKMGHDALMIPMYLPLVQEEHAEDKMPIFFGGLNVYLQENFPFFRNTPHWLDVILDSSIILKLLSKCSGMTSGSDLGPLTLSMLQGEEGRQSKELDKLIDWLSQQESPDAIILSTGLQVGLVRLLKKKLKTKVICFFQGEDSFLDELDENHSKLCWNEMAKRADEADIRYVPSHYYKDLMAHKMKRSVDFFSYLPNGINAEIYENCTRTHTHKRVIGFLARMSEQKGLHVLVDAYIELRKHGRFDDVELHIAGAQTSGDTPLLNKLKQRLGAANLIDSVQFFPNLSLEDKVSFMRSIDIFSVPAVYSEAFGLYILEAMAAAIPVVQPEASAFPEIIEKTEGGLLFEKENVLSLSEKLAELLDNEEQRNLLGSKGQKMVREFFSLDYVAGQLAGHIKESLDINTKMEN